MVIPGVVFQMHLTAERVTHLSHSIACIVEFLRTVEHVADLVSQMSIYDIIIKYMCVESFPCFLYKIPTIRNNGNQTR